MSELRPNTLTKEERLSSKTGISRLMDGGKWGSVSDFKFCYLRSEEAHPNRIMISVPKRYFKRAVRRNLLKRRIREAYRTQKGILTTSGTDILFVYNSKEILDFKAISGRISEILTKISAS